jgi:pyrimidine-nucleoside phosphorylase
MMRAVDIIAKKRDGQALNEAEIQWFIRAYSNDQLPDYQAAALLMAIVLRGMTIDETTALTLAMAESGETLDLSEIAGYVVDKHSSGGVGDKTSLVVLPLVASCGVPVAKMSGRGLGFSGGTLDKLEAIPGFRVDLSEAQFYEQAQRIGLSLSGQSHDLAPADGKLYALRDVTATVPSLPLIASSIMSKKIAAGANGIVLDVKTGNGAFMRTLDDARELAQVMVGIGQQVGRDVVALLSDMNQPLGCAVGNALEVIEAVDTLKGGGPEDFRLHCLEVAAYMLQLAGRGDRWTDLDDVKAYLERQIASDAALTKFREMVDAQGGDSRVIDNPDLLPQASLVESVTAPRAGYVARVLAEDIAWAAFDLGAGRERKGDPIDPAVGVVVHKKVGDSVDAGETVATLYANSPLDSCRERVSRAFAYSDDVVEPLPLFYGVIR